MQRDGSGGSLRQPWAGSNRRDQPKLFSRGGLWASRLQTRDPRRLTATRCLIAESEVQRRATSPEARLLTIFDVFDSWCRQRALTSKLAPCMSEKPKQVTSGISQRSSFQSFVKPRHMRSIYHPPRSGVNEPTATRARWRCACRDGLHGRSPSTAE